MYLINHLTKLAWPWLYVNCSKFFPDMTSSNLITALGSRCSEVMPIVQKPRKSEDMQFAQGHTISRARIPKLLRLQTSAPDHDDKTGRADGPGTQQACMAGVWGAVGLEGDCVGVEKVVCGALDLSLHNFT